MPGDGTISERALARRAAQRTQLEKLMSHCMDLYTQYASGPCSKDKIQPLVAAVSSVLTKIETISKLDETIQEEASLADLPNLIIEADDYMNGKNAEIQKYKFYVDNSLSRSENPTGNSNGHSSAYSKKVNLPKLQLPSFNGDILHWNSFYETFCAAVHNDESLDNVQRFQYLKAQLQGEAARTIEGLSLSNANYEEAIELLTNRYGQPHKIISEYMKSLWELPNPENGNLSALKRFYDRIETCVRGLKALGKTEDSYGDFLVPLLFEKLPTDTRTQISRGHGDKAWSLSELRLALENEISTRTAAGETISDFRAKPQASASAFHQSGLKHKPKREGIYKPKCNFCKGSHSSIKCDIVEDVKKRWEIVKRERLCYNCLSSKHRVPQCQSTYSCRHCKQKHHTALCDGSGSEGGESSQMGLTPTRNTQVLLKTAVATIRSENSSTSVNILFDEGAQRSFVTAKTVERLNVDLNSCFREKINVTGFGAKTTGIRLLSVTELKLDTPDGNVNIAALVVPKISTSMRNYTAASIQKFPYLRELNLASHVTTDSYEVDLLIGADYYWSIVGDNTVRGDGPTAVNSKLGYLLSGPSGIHANVCSVANFKVLLEQSPETKFWDMELIGIQDMDSLADQESTISYRKYRKQLERDDDGKYVAKLPWKEDHDPLPTNYEACVKRTQSMINRLPSDLTKIYDKIIRDQIKGGFIEEIPYDNHQDGHYLPHHSVANDSETTPIRIVYDCSFSTKTNPSLNDCLEPGESLINDLVSILLRFRVGQIGLSSDIEKAFLNVRLHKDDRKYTKFLWSKDPNNQSEGLQVFRFKSVLFGSVCSPFILNSVVRFHLESENSTISQDVTKNIYVDNILCSRNTHEDADSFYNSINKTMENGGFNLRSWATNDRILREKMVSDKSTDENTTVNVVGLRWNTETDELSYPDSKLQESEVFTKREVVRVSASLFDPLGLLTPVHIRAKAFIQTLWASKYDWDEILPDDLKTEWNDIFNDIQSSRDITIARQYTSRPGSYESHIFCDASQSAYGAMCYLRSLETSEVSLVMARSRVKPLKGDMTIPTLELMAALLGARLSNFVKNSLTNVQITKSTLWSDSQITIHWINSKKKLPVFVQNRVNEIQRAGLDAVAYCPTTDNPADILSRGCSTRELRDSHLWWQGPEWLPHGDWPITNLNIDSTVSLCLENSNDHVCITADVAKPRESKRSFGLHEIIDIHRYSKMEKLFRVVCLQICSKFERNGLQQK